MGKGRDGGPAGEGIGGGGHTGVERDRVGRAREKNNIRMLISSPSDRNTNPRCGDGR